LIHFYKRTRIEKVNSSVNKKLNVPCDKK